MATCWFLTSPKISDRPGHCALPQETALSEIWRKYHLPSCLRFIQESVTMPSSLSLLLVGATTTISLVAAIGAQGTFILRQGIIGRYITPILVFCFLSDVLMIGLGVVGLGVLLHTAPWIMEVFRYIGVVFLTWFGYGAARRVFTPHALVVDDKAAGPQSLKAALATTAAVTYLNPHAWLDTTVLLGSLANAQGNPGRWWYYLGCCCGSFIWFVTIGYGSRLLRPLFARPAAWRVLDAATALLMVYLVFSLLTMDLPTH